MKLAGEHRIKPLELLVLILLGAGLNQSSVIGGVNLSVADFVLPVAILMTITRGNVRFPPVVALAFLGFTAYILIVSLLVPINTVLASVDQASILLNYAKLVICFAYFVFAYIASNSNRIETVVRAFTFTAIIVGALGVAGALVPSLPLPESFYFGPERLRGFMNDPNYFSVVQLAALALLIRDKRITFRVKVPFAIILVSSVLLSGSKTGFIALSDILAFMIVRWSFGSANGDGPSPIRMTAGVFGGVLLGLVAVQVLSPERRLAIATSLETVPALNRLAPLILDIGGGLEGSGSGRTTAWQSAIEVIGVSPVTGVGVGTYTDVSRTLTGEGVLAHNSFLQLSAEWGIPVALAFFATIAAIMLFTPASQDEVGLLLGCRDACLAILVGSLGVSLNNSRLFWVILGALFAGYALARSAEHSTERRVERHVGSGIVGGRRRMLLT